jgi:hypothetical protein
MWPNMAGLRGLGLLFVYKQQVHGSVRKPPGMQFFLVFTAALLAVAASASPPMQYETSIQLAPGFTYSFSVAGGVRAHAFAL